ncbi:MAG: glycosyltransferase [Anaerolineales bacterium]|nr:glycosyltransferase [Anaerolineales bacterium]
MTDKLHVAMLSYHTCPLATLGGKDTGGMNVYVKELTCRLGRMNVHADVYTRSQDEHIPQVVHDLGYGNRVVHIPAGPEVPLPKAQLAEYIPDFVDGILKFTAKKEISYDLIHSHYWMSGIAARDLKAAWDVPVVHMFHTLGLMKNRIAGEGEYEGDYRIDGEREVLDIADLVVAATPAELAQLQWLYEINADHLTVVPPGVDTCHFYPIPKDEAKNYIGAKEQNCMILFVGRIEPLKGIDTLIRAVALMHDQGFLNTYEVCLSIIGGDADVSEELMSAEMTRLMNLCSELGIDEYVNFMGKRSQEKLPYFYSAANVVVVPSHYESFGMVALEAMACGTPVIASQVGGLAYLIQDGETGYHIPNQDPQALSEKLMLLLSDPDLRRDMSLKAAMYARDYSWSNIANQIIEAYKRVLCPKKGGKIYTHEIGM